MNKIENFTFGFFLIMRKGSNTDRAIALDYSKRYFASTSTACQYSFNTICTSYIHAL